MVKKVRIDRRQTTKDTGIATVPAPMSDGSTKTFKIAEEVRDLLNKREYHAPNKTGFDPHTATTKELEEIKFSGFRVNRLANRVELWVVGKIGGSKPLDAAANNPGILATLHEEVFLTIGTLVTTDTPVKTEADLKLLKQLEKDAKRRAN